MGIGNPCAGSVMKSNRKSANYRNKNEGEGASVKELADPTHSARHALLPLSSKLFAGLDKRISFVFF